MRRHAWTLLLWALWVVTGGRASDERDAVEEHRRRLIVDGPTLP